MRTNAEEALHSLLTVYGSIHPDSDTLLPAIDSQDREQLSRLVCSILLSGSSCQWGAVHGIYHGLGGMIDYLGVQTLWEAAAKNNDALGNAIRICMDAIPSGAVSAIAASRQIIRHIYQTIAHDDLRDAFTADPEDVRQLVATLTGDPVPAIFILSALGHSETRPLPTSGASLCLMRLGLLDPYQSHLFVGEAYEAVREEARRVLERHPVGVALMSEWWMTNCPDGCCICPAAGVGASCDALLKGLV
jgi:hypothetical protein